MPIEWVVAALVTAITVLAGAVGFAVKRHLDDDAKRDKADADVLADRTRERDEWKAIAQGSSRDMGTLVPATSKLASAVEAEHRVAQDFRAGIGRQVDEIRGDIRELLGRRGR